MATVIAKNTTGSSVLIEDLGIEVNPSGLLNLSELFEFEDISGSDDLKFLVNNGTLIINDGVLDLSLANGLKHIYHQTTYEDSFEDGDTNTLGQLNSVQIRRTTGLALTTSWQDIYFDTLDLQTNANAVEFSTTDKDRILINSPGLYLLYYSFTVRSSGATRDCSSRVMKNDTTIIPGTATLQNLYQNETHQQSETAICQFVAGDFITLQVQAASTPIETMAGYVLHLTKLEGMAGAKGEPGEPGIVAGSLELASLQIRRTTDISDIPLSAIDITFDTTDIETASNILEHNNVNPERIDIKQTGTYFITYSFEVDDECFSQVMLNGSSVLPGSLRHMGDVTQEGDYVTVVHHSFLATLVGGDFLTMQTWASTTYENMFHDIVFGIHKLEGITGAEGPQGIQGVQGIQGPPGAASSINESGNLDEAKITSIISTSGASPTNLFFYLVQADNRSNTSLPVGIIGNMATHVILYNGTTWSDIGPFVGIKGDTGAQGIQGIPGINGTNGIDGLSVKVQKDSADIMTAVATLNFTGNVAVTTSPSSKVNVAVAPIQICQVYHIVGGINLNNTTPIALPFSGQSIVDSYYTHSKTVNNTRVTVNTTGWYKVRYCVSYQSSNRSDIHSYIRSNGTTKVLLTDTYSCIGDKDNPYETNTTTCFVYLTSGTYIELMSERMGDATTSSSLANQCWLNLEFIRGA